MDKKQVEKDHYEFTAYMGKNRWISVWHQLNEVLAFSPNTVLEIGPGPGIFKTVGRLLEIQIKTLDIDPDLHPDYVSSVIDMPFQENSFDVCCAFQVLEHLPYEKALNAFKEMMRVAKKGVVLSLPDARTLWRYELHIPKKGPVHIFIPRIIMLKKHHFNGEHYWEINKTGYRLKKVLRDLNSSCNNILETTTYRVPENTYHRFFVFKKGMSKSSAS